MYVYCGSGEEENETGKSKRNRAHVLLGNTKDQLTN